MYSKGYENQYWHMSAEKKCRPTLSQEQVVIMWTREEPLMRLAEQVVHTGKEHAESAHASRRAKESLLDQSNHQQNA
jgi:hypothetical protein